MNVSNNLIALKDIPLSEAMDIDNSEDSPDKRCTKMKAENNPEPFAYLTESGRGANPSCVPKSVVPVPVAPISSSSAAVPCNPPVLGPVHTSPTSTAATIAKLLRVSAAGVPAVATATSGDSGAVYDAIAAESCEPVFETIATTSIATRLDGVYVYDKSIQLDMPELVCLIAERVLASALPCPHLTDDLTDEL